VEHVLSAKYFEGMIGLEVAKSIPTWFKDQSLRYNVSLFREEVDEDASTFDLVQLVQEELIRFNESDRARNIIEAIIQKLDEFLRLEEEGRASSALGKFLDRNLRREDAVVRSVVNLTVSQNQAALSSSSASIDMGALAQELSMMAAEARRSRVATSEDLAAIDAAQHAAEASDERGVLSNLRKVTSVAIGLAKQIGAPVLTSLIETKLHVR
jgi:hypothetical protein